MQKLKIKLLFILLVAAKSMFATYINSNYAEQVLDDNKVLQNRAEFASGKAWQLKDTYPDSSFYYANMALILAQKIQDKKLVAYSLSDIGNYYKRKEKYQKALKFYSKSLFIRKEIGSISDVASGYNQIGLLYKQQENYDSAKVYFAKGINLLKTAENTKIQLKLYDGYAMTLYHIGQEDVALAYLDSSFILASQLKDSLILAKTMQNKGIINQYLGFDLIALEYYQEAEEYYTHLDNMNGIIDITVNKSALLLKQEKYNLAISLLKRAEELSLQYGFEDNLFSIYMDLAACFPDDSEMAVIYFMKAHQNAIDFGKIPAQIESALELGRLLVKQNKLDEIENVLFELDTLIQDFSTPNLEFQLYRLKSDYYSLLKDFENAFLYAECSIFVQDSLHQNLNDLQDIYVTLEKERNEKKLALEALRTSRAEQESIQLKSVRDQMIIWGLIGIIFFLGLLYIARRRRQQIEQEKRLQEERYKAILQQKSYEANLIFLEETLALETEIREEIGQELHDHLGSKLAVVQMTIEGLVKSTVEETNVSATLTDLVELVDRSCTDMRSISHNLIQHDKTTDSLNQSFKNHCEIITKSGQLTIDYTLTGDVYPLSQNIKRHIHSTVTLLIDNIIQHSSATEASLQLFYHDDCINIEIVDNGIGFDNKNPSEGGVGLRNATKRITEIKGDIIIDSQPNDGTFISIIIPIFNT